MSSALASAMRKALSAFTGRQMPAPHRLVLQHLAAVAGAGGIAVAPGAEVAAATGLGQRTVGGCLDDLEQAGWVAGERRRPRPTAWTLSTNGGTIARERQGRHDARGAHSNQHGAHIQTAAATVPAPVSEVRLKTHEEKDLCAVEKVSSPAAPRFDPADLCDEDPADADDARLAVARAALPPVDFAGWTLWRRMVRFPILRRAEAADGSVNPGSLARQAQGLARRLHAEGLPLGAGCAAVAAVAVELATERAGVETTGGAWTPPTMAVLAQRLAARMVLR